MVGSYCTSKLFQEMFHGRKTNLFKKSPRLFGFQRSQIESQLNHSYRRAKILWNCLQKKLLRVFDQELVGKLHRPV